MNLKTEQKNLTNANLSLQYLNLSYRVQQKQAASDDDVDRGFTFWSFSSIFFSL